MAMKNLKEVMVVTAEKKKTMDKVAGEMLGMIKMIEMIEEVVVDMIEEMVVATIEAVEEATGMETKMKKTIQSCSLEDLQVMNLKSRLEKSLENSVKLLMSQF
jgi:hypothetical protein